MVIQTSEIASFFKKVLEVYEKNELHLNKDLLKFSDTAVQKALTGDWHLCVTELRDILSSTLTPILTSTHAFEQNPYVRDIKLPDGKTIYIAIINQQSREWYGTEHTIGSFDFILETQRGVFKDCHTFLDLGGHQLVWATYYALTSNEASVKSFEPSILNAVIGLFNCLINGVIDKVEVIPFAVSVSSSTTEKNDSDKMLVDFMTIPLKTCHLTEGSKDYFDFVKTDIEGYEYELLGDATFVQVIKHSKNAHFELHLGHLIKRGITLEDCINSLKRAQLEGKELYSQKEMYSFLQTCDRNGFYSFLIS
jgi:hypothetical protein